MRHGVLGLLAAALWLCTGSNAHAQYSGGARIGKTGFDNNFFLSGLTGRGSASLGLGTLYRNAQASTPGASRGGSRGGSRGAASIGGGSTGGYRRPSSSFRR